MIAFKDFYLIRTPYLPLNLVQNISNWQLSDLPQQINEIFNTPDLQEAIYIASPELYQQWQKWQEGQLTDTAAVNKLALSLFRYLLRMISRCTPYGLFAGCATGKPAEHTSIVLAPREEYKKHCRLDMNYVAELTNMIIREPAIKEQLTWFPNNSIYKMAGAYRYAAFTIQNKFRHYDLTAVNASEYLDAVLSRAENGASIPELCEILINDEISLEEAREFILELIDSQILLSTFEPTVTGEEFFRVLLGKLSALQHTDPLLHPLTRIHELLQNQSAGVDKYFETHALVRALLPETQRKDLVQTDLFLATDSNTLSQSLIADIQQQVQQLWKIARPANNNDLKNFCKAFAERYEEGEVPLVAVLDTDAGIGYGDHTGTAADHTPLVDKIFTGQQTETTSIPWSKFHTFQTQKLKACLLAGQQEIVLSNDDLNELQDKKEPVIPDSLYLMGSILGASAEAIDAGEYRFELGVCTGPSAANLLGRFCHGDTTLTAKVKECLREEEQYRPNTVFAEVIHLPESRTGNILMRPQLRDYEIVYLGQGSVPNSHQIPLSDLLVSVQQDTVILRSKKLNKQVIPRLSTAHNFHAGSLPAYKFLCDLQTQQLTPFLSWQWNLAGEEPFLPRVRYGKIILSRCTWILHKKDFPSLNNLPKKGNQSPDIATFSKELKGRLQLPRYVVLAEGDNELLLDTGNECCLQILSATLLKKEKVNLQEVLNTVDQCWIKSAEGVYTNEVIFPLKSTRPVPITTAGATADTTVITPPQRRFLPGSEWLYVKIYGGTASGENILKNILRPLVQELMEEQIIDKWFFIRYADPNPHIRIRFHQTDGGNFWQQVLERLHTAISDAGQELTYRIQLDTYEREIERYGYHTMEFSEDFFHIDSEAVIELLDLLDGEEGEQFRWLLAARGIDMLLDDFGYDLAAKAALLKRMQQAFHTEFGGAKSLLQQLNDKYRDHTPRLHSLLDPNQDEANEIEAAIALFNRRSERLRAAISAFGNNDGEPAPFIDRMTSYIHMFINRMILSNQRKHELVIYHYLERYYSSRLAIHKKQSV
ncbi:lantibiotic dehydratase [Chitinophaga pendula]|uniref:lantibiotic dehydratase n=1 Tax=Chitinophaga TaxID=79328 RepID=UPI000BB07A2D|nr:MULTISPECIES: lantibiotic dehydratase [Chitinophaga]ASZ11017.1 hypothetical protein CK934_08595 [Chitinophaga sp. MD30]UCJ05988.1 lantibiotic dehydratase [Chitinophaga pendula]